MTVDEAWAWLAIRLDRADWAPEHHALTAVVNEVERLRTDNTELRSIVADVLLYFVMPSGEKKRAIRERITKIPKPGAGT